MEWDLLNVDRIGSDRTAFFFLLFAGVGREASERGELTAGVPILMRVRNEEAGRQAGRQAGR